MTVAYQTNRSVEIIIAMNLQVGNIIQGVILPPSYGLCLTLVEELVHRESKSGRIVDSS